MQDLLGEWGTGIEVKEGVLDLVGVELVTARLASGFGNYMDFLINQMDAAIIPVERSWKVRDFWVS